MNVIKKSGKTETFSTDKLKRSIEAANKGTNEDINMAHIIEELNDVFSERESVTTKEIDLIVCGLLYTEERYQTVLSYKTYDK